MTQNIDPVRRNDPDGSTLAAAPGAVVLDLGWLYVATGSLAVTFIAAVITVVLALCAGFCSRNTGECQ